ncbi:MAG TPA: M14 family metallopeptidase [Burkholderiales bacterium]|nr:M14 family metallopeptidase [Burkholderiales bacterium]
MNTACFSESYAQARHRFREAATALNANLHAYVIETACEEKLAVDVAVLGAEADPAMVVSSGIHGVEGYFGSAVQLALLERLADTGLQQNIRYVLIHAVNPYGFAQGRRANEDNVDLNRNFLLNGSRYAGAPGGYANLDPFLNPQSPPSRFEPFALQALWKIAHGGLQPLKESVAVGQYEYPRGLFFGGKGPCASTRIVQDNCDAWLAASQQIAHIDLHAGLGAFGTPKLLLNEAADSQHYAWYVRAFGAGNVEPLAQPGGTAYNATGVFGRWMQHHFSAREYRFVGAEFGTYGVIKVLAAMRAENRAHYYCARGDAAYARAKAELQECFCPASAAWRQQVVQAGLQLVDQGVSALERHRK